MHSVHAQVKLLKCLVDNIVVDISFNQLGGLFTLNFLEEMDMQIGKNHLFKRSIILVSERIWGTAACDVPQQNVALTDALRQTQRRWGTQL
jgi:hypothetical protein